MGLWLAVLHDACPDCACGLTCNPARPDMYRMFEKNPRNSSTHVTALVVVMACKVNNIVAQFLLSSCASLATAGAPACQHCTDPVSHLSVAMSGHPGGNR